MDRKSFDVALTTEIHADISLYPTSEYAILDAVDVKGEIT